jgi:hypothetical protein
MVVPKWTRKGRISTDSTYMTKEMPMSKKRPSQLETGRVAFGVSGLAEEVEKCDIGARIYEPQSGVDSWAEEGRWQPEVETLVAEEPFEGLIDVVDIESSRYTKSDLGERKQTEDVDQSYRLWDTSVEAEYPDSEVCSGCLRKTAYPDVLALSIIPVVQVGSIQL